MYSQLALDIGLDWLRKNNPMGVMVRRTAKSKISDKIDLKPKK